MENKKSIEVCFSPISYPLFANDEAIVVVIDIFRATSAICTAIYHGINAIIPVATIEEAQAYQSSGYLAAAERNGEVHPGFEFGNSPFSYMDEALKGKEIVLTTTNGTQAIQASQNAYRVVIGSFLNLTVLSEWLIGQNRNVVLLCAGWKNKFNMEDTLFAGAVAQKLLLSGNFENKCDTTHLACLLFENAKGNLFDFLGDSSHRRRLEKLNLEKDIRYCLLPDQTPVIPFLKGKSIVKMPI
jgi:2-phosphosulfolactate phosphatase